MLQEPTSSTLTCKICCEPAHGVHFGVASCRACAAFFRRTTVLGKKYTCRQKNEKCTTNNEDRFNCRYCRYQKCLSNGMTPENVKYNYDAAVHYNKKPSPKMKIDAHEPPSDPSSPVNSDHKICVPQTKDVTYEVQTDEKGEPIVKLDITGLLNNITSVFDDFVPSEEIRNLNTLQRMNHALIEYRQIHHSNVIKFVQSISMKDILMTGNDQIKSITKFLMHSIPFQSLRNEEQMQMLKSIWVQWKRLERYASTAQIFGKRMYEDQIVTLVPGQAAYLNKVRVENCSFIYKKAEGMNFMENFNTRMMEEVGKPLVELELTSVEIAFMLAQLSWQVAGKELQGDVLKASESEQEALANELHLYYIQELRLPNYAARLIKIMNIINSAQKIHFERQNFMDIVRIFDFFRVHVSDPEMYKSYF
ncbi:Nuclear Hormone Receptor family [Caenorhabditis elegans]|uniref:Nuclear Hormone Receptor family n=1 Tax=Caenorhabditis elegans TaxID=6239 RepID=A0A486WVR6_CAEEL|nr:Nuclear Hormone Receptor family [Caenorhabditis elegans]VGM69604.1 Nuclear Hormone Receptor family [Caenorhabditis elegans]